MAIKYKRDQDGDEPFPRFSQRLGRPEEVRPGGLFSFRPGGSGLIISVGAVIFALLLLQNAVNRMTADTPPPRTTTGAVLGKTEPGPDMPGSAPRLRLRLELEEGAVHEIWVDTDPESWERVGEGDALEVEYTLSQTTGAVRVVGMRAVPEDGESAEQDNDETL